MDENNNDKKMSGILIPAGLFLGMGVGFLIGNIPAGIFFGLGAGFVAYAIAYFVTKK